MLDQFYNTAMNIPADKNVKRLVKRRPLVLFGMEGPEADLKVGPGVLLEVVEVVVLLDEVVEEDESKLVAIAVCG